jgi:hypothetical protein
MDPASPAALEIMGEFRARYADLEARVVFAVVGAQFSMHHLSRLGDELDTLALVLHEVSVSIRSTPSGY